MNSHFICHNLRPVYMILLALFLALPASLGSDPTTAHAALSSIVNDDFNAIATGSFPTGWTLENGAGGTVSVQEFPSASDKSMKLNDTSSSANVIVNKPFSAPAGLTMTVEFDIYPSQTNMFIAAGYIMNGSATERANTVYFDSSGSQIAAWDGSTAVNLQSYTANTWYHMKYVMDFNTKKYDVYINGVLKANNLGFNGTPQAGSKIQFFTGSSQTGSVYINNAQVSTGGILKLLTNKAFDDFNGITTGSAPTGWNLDNVTGGTATVENVPSSIDKSIKLNDTSAVSGQNVQVSKTFASVTGKLTAEFEVMLGQTNAIVATGYLADSTGNNLAARVYFNASGEIRAYNGASSELVTTYTSNQWYRIKLILDTATAKYDVYVNGKIMKSGISFNTAVSSLSQIQFYTSSTYTGVLYVDNVNISGEGDLESTNYGSTYNVTGNPIGGGEGYSKLVNSGTTVSTASGLVTAMNNAVSGDVIYVDDSADLDVTNSLPLNLKAGVTLASGRGKIINGTLSQGARLKTVPDAPGGANRSIITVVGEGARVTGLRLDGGDSSRGDLVTRYLPWTNCVYAWGYNTTEVDNNDITGNRWGGVAINDGNVHHNKIHDNPYWELGYGIVQDGSNTTGGLLVEGNLFDNNRHDIASTGKNTSRYEARYNTTLRYDYGHAYDMHRDLTCNCAGDWVKVHHNTFVDKDNAGNKAILIRGIPVTSANSYNNWFYNPSWSVDIVQANVTQASPNFIVGTNKYGVSPNIQYLTNKFSTMPTE